MKRTLWSISLFLCVSPLALTVFGAYELPRSAVRVSVTSQAYNFVEPWRKQAPRSRQALGAVIGDNRVLVTAELVQDHTYVEIEKPGTGAKTPAKVEVVDYSANLALISASEPEFMSDFKPLRIGKPLKVGDEAEAWQLQKNDTLLRTDALLTTVQIATYPKGDLSLLTYQLTSSLPSRGGSFAVPLVRKGRLVGVVTRVNSEKQSMSAIPVDVIEHFLADAEDGEYAGFPSLGISLSATRDPQFREYIGLPRDGGGVYVTSVTTGRPGQKAELQAGDVIEQVDGYEIDRHGNYEDRTYGRVYLSNLISVRCHAGDTLKLQVRRNGERMDVEAVPQRKEFDDYVSPPYIVDTPPKFIIVGGLVIQELSGQYLQSWGQNWMQKADQQLVYYHANQATLFPKADRKIVFLSRVLSTNATSGYSSLQQLVITKVNGRDIRGLHDVREALESPEDGFHHFEFEDDPLRIAVAVKAIPQANLLLRRRYGIAILER